VDYFVSRFAARMGTRIREVERRMLETIQRLFVAWQERCTLKVDKPDRLAFARIDRDESKMCARLDTLP
jgi:hypothetical protein